MTASPGLQYQELAGGVKQEETQREKLKMFFSPFPRYVKFHPYAKASIPRDGWVSASDFCNKQLTLRAKREPGTGLAWSICRQMMQSMSTKE